MSWNTNELQTRFNLTENAQVVEYLVRVSPHAHSDLGMEMFEASKDIPNRLYYGPNATNCSYIFLHTEEGVIYSLIVDMRTLAFRLPAENITEALNEGGVLYAELGAGWISFNPFMATETTYKTRARMKRWCHCAHEHAHSRSPK